MKNPTVTLSREQAKTFAAVIGIEEIKAFIAARQEEFQRFCIEEAEKFQQQAPPPIRRRASRKGVAV